MPDLYICPATQGAITVAAPLLTDRGDAITHALILRGVKDAANPTPNEQREAIRPAKYIARFLEHDLRKKDIQILDVDPLELIDVFEKLKSVLTIEYIQKFDSIMLNCQSGTKQMSFGAWDAIKASTFGKNISILRCFVGRGTVDFSDDGKKFDIIPLSVKAHLRLYGWEITNEAESIKEEAWMRANEEDILSYGNARSSGNDSTASRIISKMVREERMGPYFDLFRDGGMWLEAYTYLVALRERPSEKKSYKIRSRVKIRDMNAEVVSYRSGVVDNHYEIDLAITAPGVINIVECKSYIVEAGNIDKLETIRNRIQGRAGITAILSNVPQGDDTILGQKAKAGNVSWLSNNSESIDSTIKAAFA